MLTRGVIPTILLLLMMSLADAADGPLALPKAPSFTLPGLDLKVHRLSDYVGKVVVVNFWASWCVPCRLELPSMNNAARILRDDPIVWLAVNVGEDREAVMAFRRDYAIDFPVLLDTDGKASGDWRVTGMPSTFVINQQGDLVQHIVGKRDWDDVTHLRILRQLIAGDQHRQLPTESRHIESD